MQSHRPAAALEGYLGTPIESHACLASSCTEVQAMALELMQAMPTLDKAGADNAMKCLQLACLGAGNQNPPCAAAGDSEEHVLESILGRAQLAYEDRMAELLLQRFRRHQ